MKVLYISYDGMTDPLGQSQVLPYLVQLSKKDIQFHLLSFEKHDKFIKNKMLIENICESANITWHPQDYHIEGGISKTLKQIKRMKRVAFYLHDKHNFQIIHCRSYISALVGLKMKRKFGVKFLFDMRGFWADERVDGKLWNLESPIYKAIYKFFKKKELQYLNEADFSVVLTSNGRDEILRWKEVKNIEKRLEVIPCCVNLDLFNPIAISPSDQARLKEHLNIKSDDYVLGYVGSIGTWYMLDEMLAFFKTVDKAHDNAKFLFVTGDDSIEITNRAQKNGIDTSKIIITSCIHSEMPLHISIFNSSVFFIRPSYSKKASSPTKQGEIMAMGIPLVCNAGVGDTDLIVQKYHAGGIVEDFNDEEYQHAIDTLDFNKEKSIRGAEEFFSLQSGVTKYYDIYKTING